MAHHIVGVAALASGDVAAAAAELATAVALADQLGYRHPGFIPRAAGCHRGPRPRRRRRRRASASPTSSTRRLPRCGCPGSTRRPAAAVAWRCWSPAISRPRAELSAAMTEFDALGYRLDAARTEVLVGRALRRAGLRTAAATTLDEAQARLVGDARRAVGGPGRCRARACRTWPRRGHVDADRVANRRPRRPRPAQPGDRRRAAGQRWRRSRRTSRGSTASWACGRAPSSPGASAPALDPADAIEGDVGEPRYRPPDRLRTVEPCGECARCSSGSINRCRCSTGEWCPTSTSTTPPARPPFVAVMDDDRALPAVLLGRPPGDRLQVARQHRGLRVGAGRSSGRSSVPTPTATSSCSPRTRRRRSTSSPGRCRSTTATSC